MKRTTFEIPNMYGSTRQDYEIGHLLGKGGFAEVYYGKYLKNGYPVAIKMINKKTIRDRGKEARVMEEVRIHATLKHPFIVELYTFFEDQDYVYLVLELCSQGDLGTYIKKHGVLFESQACEIVHQVVDGLTYLHSRNILHRDIKAANLLLKQNMQVKIADFGLATKVQSKNEIHTTMCGTPNYISPEVATRAPHGSPVDVWALGVLLYSLLVGVEPFATPSIKETLTKVVMTNYLVPDHLSFEAKDLLYKLLQKNPVERITVNEILEHPFMRRRCGQLIDSGYTTLSQVNTPGRNESVEDLSHRLVECNLKSRSRSADPSQRLAYSNTEIRKIKNFNERTCFSENTISRNAYNIQCTPNLTQALAHSTHNQYSGVSHNDNVVSGQYCQENSPLCSSSQNYQMMPESIRVGEVNSYSRFAGDHRNCGTSSSSPSERGTVTSQLSRISDKRGNENVPLEREMKIDEYRIVVNGKPIPPLCTKRLPPRRMKTNLAMFSILESGEVVLEFFKKNGKPDKVGLCCRISGDGIRVILYTVNARLLDKPRDIPEGGADSIWCYENLPKKYWIKYRHGAVFVRLCQSLTPKITYHSDLAKCFLMENQPDADFEVQFYSGGKVRKTGQKIKISDENGITTSFTIDQPGELSKTAHEMWQYFQEVYSFCLSLESSLVALESSSKKHSPFPFIAGSKPSSVLSVINNKENMIPTALHNQVHSYEALRQPVQIRAQSTPYHSRDKRH